MPQTPSSNMGIIWPTDHNDADAWDVIMDTAIRTTIDAHDHSAGKGVLVPTGGLKIDADISWSFNGLSRAITDLRAIDFSPQAASGMTALAGALFLNSADNELYYRTTGGSNVKVTAGTALNVAGFTGGIGGDYAATGALVIFDDATDSYWFQQQIGAAVRQYARMRSADVDLYEFKANPTAGVPTNRVRLASPTALAASYTLTMPGSIPAAGGPLSVDAAGNVLTVEKHGIRTLQISFYAFQPIEQAVTPASYSSGRLNMTTVQAGTSILLPVGKRIREVRVFIADNATGPTKLQSAFMSNTGSTATATIAGSTQSLGNGTNQTLIITGLTTTITAGTTYSILVLTPVGAAVGTVWLAEVDYDQP